MGKPVQGYEQNQPFPGEQGADEVDNRWRVENGDADSDNGSDDKFFG